MYKDKDPRADLFAPAFNTAMTGLIAEEQLALFYQQAPQEPDDKSRNWYVRGCNFIVAYSETDEGAIFERQNQADEYVLYIENEADIAIVEWNGEKKEIEGHSIVFIPPGNSQITLPKGGKITRLFTTKSEDLLKLCFNNKDYAKSRAHIPPFLAWPEPVNGWKIHHYSLDVPDEPGRFGRIFRCTTFMINVLPVQIGPRDPSKLSPHHHDDFEQCSLTLKGSFAHYLRWHWTTDLNDWKQDKVIEVNSPSVLVIPPPVIHTTRATDSDENKLVDIFCPPRMDFSLKAGWVINADDYPLPQNQP